MTDGSQYAEDLLQLFRGRDVSLAGPIGVMGVFRLRSPLARRMKMLLQREDQLSTRLSRPWIAAAAVSSLGLVLILSSVLGLRLASAGDDGRASDSSVLDRSDAARGLAERSESHNADESNPFQRRSDAAPESDLENRVSADTGETLGANAAPGTGDTSANWRRTRVRPAPGPKSTISGLVTPIVSAKIPARVQGQVASIHVKEGSRVKAGQLLVRIDDELAQLETEAKAHAADASEAMANSDIRIQVARKAAELTKVDLDEALEVSRRVPQSISAFEMRRKEFTAARQRLEVNHAEVDLEVARATHAQQLFEAKAAKAMLTRYRIAAPFDGVVSKLHVDASSWVEPGDLICQLVRLDRVRVEGYVDTADYNPEDLHGRPVTVTVARARGGGVIVAGKVSYVSVDVDALLGHFRFFADVHNPLKDGVYLIRPGMRAEINIAASPEPRRTVGDRAAESIRDAAAQVSLDAAEIEYLTELVEAYQTTWKRIFALQQAGAPGGEANNEAASRHRLCLARARLALARGDRAEAIKQYEVAVKAAETRVESCQAAYDSGSLTLDRVMDAQAERAETKLQLNQLKR